MLVHLSIISRFPFCFHHGIKPHNLGTTRHILPSTNPPQTIRPHNPQPRTQTSSLSLPPTLGKLNIHHRRRRRSQSPLSPKHHHSFPLKTPPSERHNRRPRLSPPFCTFSLGKQKDPHNPRLGSILHRFH